jgi:hypothetical protein
LLPNQKAQLRPHDWTLYQQLEALEAKLADNLRKLQSPASKF